MAYTGIDKSTNYFNTVLYTGNGSDAHGITGVGFQPDWVWTKIRSGADNHGLYDVVRGVNKNLQTNSNYAEQSYSTLLQSFDSDGFTIGTNGEINGNSSTFVSWNWRANGSGSANSDGSTTTTATSANTASGFSIIKYGGTGSSATIGHGLGATPKVCIFKQLDGTESWRVWHRDAPNYSTKALALNLTNAEFDQSGWVGTVNNSTIQLGSDGSINLNAKNYICYAFAEKTGFSKFSSHVGNGSTDGVFIYTGFKPAWFLLKPSSGSGQWFIWDSVRSPINQAQKILSPESTGAESDASGAAVDFLSNGIKIRNSDGGINQNGVTYITMAFAAAPLVGSNNVPCTAR